MSFDLVLIGGTGDLAWRKLMPALFQAFRHGKLPPGGRILSVAREDYADHSYRIWPRERVHDVEFARPPADEEFERFSALVHSLRVHLGPPAAYGKLPQW